MFYSIKILVSPIEHVDLISHLVDLISKLMGTDIRESVLEREYQRTCGVH